MKYKPTPSVPHHGRPPETQRDRRRVRTLEYPVTPSAVAAEYDDVTRLLADGECNPGALVARSEVDRFESPEDLTTELHNQLPRKAVGEPFQSEGEG
ncbi:DUF5789 family protein [Natrarchaeobaculum sulfurireducens]|uniref:Uncharacterized protein n=1 Tax=Natrarchaeobaculum sulfurireducens TaxID=2044521 RepID=A0A346PIH1_9EURY|nr:hypothetical protein [Natrarchaeobaculum sulfurireducens]AXR79316.1 hypothetical protein AArc1_3008 [Natrarchaeobaculum sulfurireducens]AXR83089.1 hypothetical protein AArcMg_3102 [Natrarchaeobaculum sulfurireducens]